MKVRCSLTFSLCFPGNEQAPIRGRLFGYVCTCTHHLSLHTNGRPNSAARAHRPNAQGSPTITAAKTVKTARAPDTGAPP